MTKKNIRTYVTFLTIGASNTMIDFLFFFFHCLLCSLFSCTVPVLYSRNAEQLCLESKMDVPSKKKADRWEWIKWATVNGVACLLTYVVLYVMQQAGFSLFISKAIGTLLGMMITFTGSRLWVFPSENKPSEMER